MEGVGGPQTFVVSAALGCGQESSEAQLLLHILKGKCPGRYNQAVPFSTITHFRTGESFASPLLDNRNH